MTHTYQPVIKLCGLMSEADVKLINEVRPDYCGFIVDYPKSHRSKTYDEVKNLSRLVSPEVKRVGVFVDPDPELPIRMLDRGIIDLVQLHGNESDDMIRSIRVATGKPVIKAYIIKNSEDIKTALNSPADHILLDKGRGDGRSFDWSLAAEADRPFFLAGGLNLHNIGEAMEYLHPFGLDISSGAETEGTKDPEKVKKIMELVRRVEE